MKVLELFSGTASFSKVATRRGHECRTLDFEEQFHPTYRMDIMEFDPELIEGWEPDIIWASPPCQCFSVMVIGKNWIKNPDGTYTPKRPQTIEAMEIAQRGLDIIRVLRPKFFFIENPRAMLRKMPFMADLTRKTVTYCQYGLPYQKATDIWTNCDAWKPKPACSPRSPCHQRAPRGAHAGLQAVGRYTGLRRTSLHPRDMGNESHVAASLRAVVPPMLCEEILIACESVPFDAEKGKKE